MVATLQLEVVRRLCAREAQDDYGLLTLLVGLHYEAHSWFKIPAACFFPEPDVESACVVLKRRSCSLLQSPTQQSCFIRIIKTSFSQRRKMMLKLLRQQFDGPTLEKAFVELGIPVGIRAERVGLRQFAALAQKLAESPK
jgi:16S rRNA (adenine1518-N6/adenine1519-N6)-dimethyltransferase